MEFALFSGLKFAKACVDAVRATLRFMLGSIAALSASPAIAGDWRIVSWNDEFVLYLDYATIRQLGAATAYQSKVLYMKDPNWAELQSTVEMRCNQKEYRNLRVSGISKEGASETVTVSKEWRKLQPGTNVEREFLIVCAR